jgi:hypothetical protein
VDGSQSRFVHFGHALVDHELSLCRRTGDRSSRVDPGGGGAPGRRAVPEVVLGGRQDRERGAQVLTLQAAQIGDSEPGDQLGILAEPFQGPAPTDILGDGDGRGEVPVDAGGGHLFGGCPADLKGQLLIAGRAQADIVQEDRRALQAVVAMDGIHPVDQGNAKGRSQRALYVSGNHLRPGCGGVLSRRSAASAQHGPNETARDILR